MALDIAVVGLILAAVGVPIAGIGIILNIYFRINDRVNEMLRIMTEDKLEVTQEMKDLEREVQTVDTTFRKYADDMSKYLTSQFEESSKEIETLKNALNSHSESLKNQQDYTGRLITVVENLAKEIYKRDTSDN